MTDEVPAKIGGLELVRRIGEGGFGVVYLAHDPRLGRKVAIKIAHPGRGDLWREARAAARLAHANVVAIHEVGDHEGSTYLVMEYVDGPTLREYLERGPIVIAEALRIARDLARAIAAAHREGIVHADLTPSNVLLSPDGRARVVDFGLARTDSVPGPLKSTAAGTPTYMAPEQWRHEQLRPPVDVWALGAIMHVLLTGAPPVEGSSELVRERIAGTSSLELAAIAELPREVATILRRCLRKDPAARPQAAEVAAQLDALLAQIDRPAPFRGDASDLVPRNAVADAIATLLERERVVTVIGAAGAGKTCALHGAVVRLRSTGWKVISVRPSLALIAAALHAIAPGAAIATLDSGVAEVLLASRAGQVAGWIDAPERFAADLDDTATAVGGRLVLVIDPLDDLLGEDAAVAATLAAAIADDGAVRLVFAARDDQVTALAKRIGDLGQTYTLPTPTRAELVEMLARPVHDAGFTYEAGLVERIVDDLAADPRAAARTREIGATLWERRDRTTSTIPYTAYAPRPRRRRGAVIAGVLAVVAAGGLALAMRESSTDSASGSCTTFYYPTQTRIPGLNATSLQDSLAGVSADGGAVLQYRRDCDVSGSWRLLLLERQGDQWSEHVLSDLPAFQDFNPLEYATTLTADALAIVGVNSTLTGLLETSRSARGRTDFAPPKPGAFVNITATAPASIRHPVLSHDGLELFYTVSDPVNAERPYWIYRAARTARTELFSPGERLDAHFLGMGHVNGLSADGLTMFVGEHNAYVVRVFTRKRRGDPFVNPNAPMSPEIVPGFRTRPLADCNILIGTCTTGCNGEDNCYFTR